jgi:hypothetical protein
MVWMIFLGSVALVVGLMLVASPQRLVRASEGLNRMVTKIDEQVLKYRIGVGVSLALGGLFLFFYAYMISRGH